MTTNPDEANPNEPPPEPDIVNPDVPSIPDREPDRPADPAIERPDLPPQPTVPDTLQFDTPGTITTTTARGEALA